MWISQDNIAAAGEGFVCICGVGVCEIGRFWGDGRFMVLYRLPEPEGASSQDVPIANWSPNFSGSRRVYREGGVPVAQLAIGWSGCLRLFEVPLLGDWVRSGTSGSGEQGSRCHFFMQYAAPSRVHPCKQCRCPYVCTRLIPRHARKVAKLNSCKQQHY